MFDPLLAPPSIIEEDIEVSQKLRRSQLMAAQTMYLNKSIEYYNINVASYLPKFDEIENPYGMRLPDSAYGALMRDLSDGVYSPDISKGEKFPTAQQYDHLKRLDFARKDLSYRVKYYSCPRVDTDFSPTTGECALEGWETDPDKLKVS